MNILGIGPMEIILILLLAILLFGPRDISRASRTVGRALNRLVRSDTWRTVNQASSRIKNLPTELMRQAGLDELQEQTAGSLKEVSRSLDRAVREAGPAPQEVILPPRPAPEAPAPQGSDSPPKEDHG